MEHVELLSSIATGIKHDSLLSSWVVWQERSDVEYLSVDDNPDVVLVCMFGNLIESEGFSTSF